MKQSEETLLEEAKEPKESIVIGEEGHTKGKSMEQMINDEISQLKDDKKFYVFDLNMQSIIFIKIADPYKDIISVKDLGAAIAHDVFVENKVLTRFCLRFLPIYFG